MLESFPPPDAGARKYVVAHAGDARRMNVKVSKNFFILLTKVSRIVQKNQNVVAHHNRMIGLYHDQAILVLGTAKVQLPLFRKS